MVNLKMETSLQNILCRINSKLKEFVGQSKDNYDYSSQKCMETEVSDSITCSQRRAPSTKNMSIITRNQTMKNYLKQSNCFKRTPKGNVFVNQEQEEKQQKISNSIQPIKQNNQGGIVNGQTIDCLKRDGDEENFLSLRKRNQALQNDIKKLQSRLKSLQCSMKGSTQKKRQKVSESGCKNVDKKGNSSVQNMQKQKGSIAKMGTKTKISFNKSKYMKTKDNWQSSNTISEKKFNKACQKASSLFQETIGTEKVVKASKQIEYDLKKKKLKKAKSSDILYWDGKLQSKVGATQQNSFQSHSSYLSPIEKKNINIST